MSENTTRTWTDVPSSMKAKKAVPDGLWERCPDCGASLFRRTLENNLWVCSECEYHFRLNADRRIQTLIDPGTFEPMDEEMSSVDPLGFVDLKPYTQRIKEARARTGKRDGVQTGIAFIKGRKIVLAVMNFEFLGGSMGSVVGEKITRAIETAESRALPLVIISASGGARMMESVFSLMQMAKTSAALGRFDDSGGLFISVLTDPTTGGVSASFAMLGDVIIAEKNALIGFAGPRVIEQTIREKLPEGFQRSEFVLQCGFVDRVVSRLDLRSEISSIIDYSGKQ